MGKPVGKNHLAKIIPIRVSRVLKKEA